MPAAGNARPASPPARAIRSGIDPFAADDDEPPEIARSLSQSPESRRIRQEALRMLEVADDQLHDGAYSVYRTKTGGFAAEPKRDPVEQKRVPAALSGLSFASSRTNVAKPFRDDPYADTEAPVPTTQESYEYGDESAVVDVARMENRSAASRAEDKSSSWSSRYSIDNTLLALSGGSVTSSVSSSKLLDKMDKDNRRSARNIFGSSPQETRAPQVFGSGFSFRQKNVFGQQDAAAKNEKNLKAAWDTSAPDDDATAPARSWQEQFQHKRRQRRNILIGVAGLVVVLIIVALSVNQTNSSKSQAVISDTPGDDDSITFYITSDVPLHSVRDNAFKNELSRMSKVADFMVHLGNVQLAQNTQCEPERYEEVATILKASPVPVFVIPGEEDWANCPNQDDGWDNWVDNFWQFEDNFKNNFDLNHMPNQQENFGFLEKGVLFVGVHETNGRIDDFLELKFRNRKNVEWVEEMYEKYGDDARAMVIFANGRPAIRANDNFYMGLGDFLFDNKIPTAYIHSNHENGKEVTYHPYEIDGMEHVIAVQCSLGEDHPPLRINVGFDENDPFIVG
uniref:Calcineurin-like phosphoesterase domain-containing protein n=1 Tax=Entomoneis paludosa TaxID=265537 RepID=A0A7S2YP96_9STRA